MKRSTSILAVVSILVLACAIPAAARADDPPAGMNAVEMKGKTHDIRAEVVSIDPKANTITIKEESGENHTAPLTGKAIEQAKQLKPGDKVTATCMDNDKGDHQGISAIAKL